jgi:hypothetical protein
MGINTATKKFRDDVLELINKSGLPMCVVELVLNSTLGAVRQKLAIDLQAEAENEVTKDAESVQSD